MQFLNDKNNTSFAKLDMHSSKPGLILEEIIKDIGNLVGITDLTTDDKGVITFAIGENILLIEEANQGILLTGFILTLPDNPSEKLLTACLTANLNAIKLCSPILAIEETTKSLILQLWTHGGPANEVITTIGRFSTHIERARDSIGTLLATNS